VAAISAVESAVGGLAVRALAGAVLALVAGALWRERSQERARDEVTDLIAPA